MEAETVTTSTSVTVLDPLKIKPVDERKLWDRQPGERPSAYRAFLYFRDLPDGAQLESVMTGLGYRSLARIYRWSGQYKWRERKVAYSVHRETMKEAEKDRIVKERISAHAATAIRLQKFGEEILDSVKVGDKGKVENALALKPALDAVIQGISMERLAYGMPTQINRTEHELRQQVQVNLDINQRVITIIRVHMCDECRERSADDLSAVSRLIEEAKEQTARHSGVGAG